MAGPADFKHVRQFLREITGTPYLISVKHKAEGNEEKLKEVVGGNAVFTGLQGLDLIVAQNNLLLAEYLVKRSKIQGRANRKQIEDLWRRAKEIMSANLAVGFPSANSSQPYPGVRQDRGNTSK